MSYWDSYYGSGLAGRAPSPFAQFVLMGAQIADLGLLFDVGCGNGHDTFFFASHGIKCCGVDNSEKAMERASDRSVSGASFWPGDLSEVDYAKHANGPYSVYSRFSLHAIDHVAEDRFIENLGDIKYLSIECRTINDELYGQGEEVGLHEFVNGHYRRFIDPHVLRGKLNWAGFDILLFEESTGFSKTPTEDPPLLRVVAQRT